MNYYLLLIILLCILIYLNYFNIQELEGLPKFGTFFKKAAKKSMDVAEGGVSSGTKSKSINRFGSISKSMADIKTAIKKKMTGNIKLTKSGKKTTDVANDVTDVTGKKVDGVADATTDTVGNAVKKVDGVADATTDTVGNAVKKVDGVADATTDTVGKTKPKLSALSVVKATAAVGAVAGTVVLINEASKDEISEETSDTYAVNIMDDQNMDGIFNYIHDRDNNQLNPDKDSYIQEDIINNDDDDKSSDNSMAGSVNNIVNTMRDSKNDTVFDVQSTAINNPIPLVSPKTKTNNAIMGGILFILLILLIFGIRWILKKNNQVLPQITLPLITPPPITLPPITLPPITLPPIIQSIPLPATTATI